MTELKLEVNRINNEVSAQSNLLDQAISAIQNKAAGGSAPTLQSKTVTPTTSSQTVTPDSGYDGLSKVTVNAMPTAAQAAPSISVSAGGLITASATQSAGYVASGTRSATKQLPVESWQITLENGTVVEKVVVLE